MNPLRSVRAFCFDWGGTLMSEHGGPEDLAMGLWPQVEVIDGASEAVAMLHGKIPLAIATNASVSTRPLIELALRRAGLDHHFSDFFCFRELHCRKDQPQFWAAVERGLQVPLRHIAMVGDSYEQDALWPRRFGVQGVWFNLNGATAETEATFPVVSTLSAFSAWVLESLDPSV